MRDAVFREFGTTSVLYGKPAFMFASPRPPLGARQQADESGTADGGAGAAGTEAGGGGRGGAFASSAALPDDNLLGLEDGADSFADSAPDEASAPPDDLSVGLGDLGGGGGGGGMLDAGGNGGYGDVLDAFSPERVLSAQPPPAAAQPGSGFVDFGGAALPPLLPPAPPTPPPSGGLQLEPSPVLDPDTFQNAWSVLETAFVQQAVLPAGCSAVAADPGAFIAQMAARRLFTIASGGGHPTLKFYLFAGAAGGSGTFLVELVMDIPSGSVAVTIKTDAPHLGDAFAAAFGDAMVHACRI